MIPGRSSASRNALAVTQYLNHYAEPEAQGLIDANLVGQWAHVLVIPAYRESASFLEQLKVWKNLLVIIVLNRPDHDNDTRCNDELRAHIERHRCVARFPVSHARLFALANEADVLLVEREQALPRAQGVGLARKLGCDMALALIYLGHINSDWIHTTDADASLPADYFSATTGAGSAVALTYSYQHDYQNSVDIPLRQQQAMRIYERYLTQYVEGLRAAGSPYAFHTLGSCIAFNAVPYANVRGFPRRAGGEDFYLLNKLAKLGGVATATTNPIRLSARCSDRVPFGTGPALNELLSHENPATASLFYHPDCFEALGRFLDAIANLEFHRGDPPDKQLSEVLDSLAAYPGLNTILHEQNLILFFEHASRQCTDEAAWQKQFHQWFDGFRTLKFIRGLSARTGKVSIDIIDRDWSILMERK